MSAAQEMALEFAERLEGLGPIRVARMFSGANLSIHGVTFALVIGGTFYLRVDDESRPRFEALGAEPFRYRTKVREVTVASYYEAPADILDDPDELPAWAADALRAARDAAEKTPKRRRGAKW